MEIGAMMGVGGMRRLTLVEHQTLRDVTLTVAQRDALQRCVPELAIAPSSGGGRRYHLTPGSWVGSARCGGQVVEVRPKLPLAHVLFLLSFAADPAGWRHGVSFYDQEASFAEAIAGAFLRCLRHATHYGLLHGYRAEEASLPSVRGRLKLSEQMQRHLGRAFPAEVEYDDLTEDRLENRLMKAALAKLCRLPLRSVAVTRQLRRAWAAFERVRLVEYEAKAVPAVFYSRLNERYRPAVELARLILRGASLEVRDGALEAAALFVDMDTVFEEFVVVSLRETLGLTECSFRQGAKWPAGSRRLALDAAGQVGLQPDLSWWEGGQCWFVGDVKYKRINVAGVEHADLYQLLAYTVAADLPSGLLIYAAGVDGASRLPPDSAPIAHQVRQAGKTLQVTSLDLGAPPEHLLGQIRLVAQRIRHSRTLAAAGMSSLA